MEKRWTLEDLIYPVMEDEFVKDYWEKSFLHLQRNNPDLYHDLFSLDDIDRWLASTGTGAANSVLITAHEGSKSSTQGYRPRDITVDKIYEAFGQGSSIVLNQLEDSWPPVFSFAKALGRTFSGDIGLNAYLTPKESQAFPLHWDPHDVFVLQVSGQKLWRLHEIKQLSIMHLQFSKDLVYLPSAGKERLEAPLLAELVLKPGDLLYIPRGMPHCAAARDETSLHLTVSVVPFYWMDFIKAALEQAGLEISGLRKALPIGFLKDRQHEAMYREFCYLLEAFGKKASFEETLEVVTRNRIYRQGFAPDGHFSHLVRLSDLSPESLLARREDVLCAVESGPDFSCIRFGLRSVRGPSHLRHPFEFIRDQERFRVKEVPGVDDQSRLVLARRLIREGLLRFAMP